MKTLLFLALTSLSFQTYSSTAVDQALGIRGHRETCRAAREELEKAVPFEARMKKLSKSDLELVLKHVQQMPTPMENELNVFRAAMELNPESIHNHYFSVAIGCSTYRMELFKILNHQLTLKGLDGGMKKRIVESVRHILLIPQHPVLMNAAINAEGLKSLIEAGFISKNSELAKTKNLQSEIKRKIAEVNSKIGKPMESLVASLEGKSSQEQAEILKKSSEFQKAKPIMRDEAATAEKYLSEIRQIVSTLK